MADDTEIVMPTSTYYIRRDGVGVWGPVSSPIVVATEPEDVGLHWRRLRTFLGMQVLCGEPELEEQTQARLLAKLSPSQRDTWTRARVPHDGTGYVDVVGQTGTYRLFNTGSGNIVRHHDRAQLCITFPGVISVPPALLVLCELMLFTLDERRFLETANHLGYLARMPPW